MLDPWKRFIQFHELKIDIDPAEATYIPLQNLYRLLTNEIDDGNSVKLIQKQSAAIRFSRFALYPAQRVLVLLAQYSDMNITDPAFQDLETGDLRTEPKLEGEGIAVSAHVAISLDPHDEVNILHHLLLEEVPGLGRSRLNPFLKSELKKVSKGNFTFIDRENGRTKNCRPNAEILGTPSKELEAELNEGVTLQGIELVRMTPATPMFDEEGYYREESTHIHITPEKNTDNTVVAILQRVKQKAVEHGFTDIKLRYKRSTTGKQKTTVMGADLGDLADVMINRDEQITSDEVLAQCNGEIVTSIAAQMVQFIVDLRNNGG